MSQKKRRHFSAEQKAQVVRRHLAGKEPVSQLADELGIQPSQIHTWVNQVLAQAEYAHNYACPNPAHPGPLRAVHWPASRSSPWPTGR